MTRAERAPSGPLAPAATVGRVRDARANELDRVAALWTAITEHHAALDPFFTQRRDARAERELGFQATPFVEGARATLAWMQRAADGQRISG